jgi:hypothetical protein
MNEFDLIFKRLNYRIKPFPSPDARRRGIATYLVIVLVAFVALSLSNVTILNRGEMTQIVKSEALIKADLAARALYQKFSWQLKCLTYENRPCKDNAHSEKFSFEGVECELLCYDSEDEAESLDIWILSKYGDTGRAIFYRVKYQQSLINSYNKITPSYSAFYNLSDMPVNKISPKTPQKILNILKDMRENLKNKSQIVKSLENTNNINQILQKLNAPSDPNILSQMPKSGAGGTQLANLSPPDKQNSDLLTLNALKKTDTSMQMANAQQIAGNPGPIGAVPEINGPPAINQNNPQANGIQNNQNGNQPNNTAANNNPGPKTTAPYSQRVSAWAKAGLANLGFGIKRFFGTANEADQKKANEATNDYLAVAKPNSFSAAAAKKYNEVINNNYEKYNKK